MEALWSLEAPLVWAALQLLGVLSSPEALWWDQGSSRVPRWLLEAPLVWEALQLLGVLSSLESLAPRL